ncbi:hypothetical protein DE146DRAFT_649608 [Phaeosphaeria sp. MPI-PUGE-AT-0046c]|nr:hypothetical protein DE146DRAFT_649608 [Phaeosphaeria sp. MPI-PUGE-AT-0046c]
MWAANRNSMPRVQQRTSSVHSIASVHSPSQTRSPSRDDVSRGKNFDLGSAPAPRKQQLEPVHHKAAPPVHEIRLTEEPKSWANATEDDVSSRSSTLDGEDDYMERLDKKPVQKLQTRKQMPNDEPRSPGPAPHIPGPLESQLAALMSKLIFMEQSNPAVSVDPQAFQKMERELKALKEEKKTWWKRHDAIWALRDEDVENNIKIRGMLAKARRELEGMTALREEDLSNVLIVRAKLAEKTRELERMHAQTGRTSPSRGRPASYLERRGTSSSHDLFVAAKTAALEQRALELEKRNSDLVAQVETLKGGAGIDDLNRLTAHQAWKDTVAGLEAKLKSKDAELARAKSGSMSISSGGGNGMDWYRVEALLEEHASYREALGGKLQALRSDKETLQRELHRKENDYQALELKLQILQRRSTIL